MAKSKVVFTCQQCGYQSVKWFGKCPSCLEWNTAVEEVARPKTEKIRGLVSENKPKSITEIRSGEYERYSTGIKELDRVLGGGIVKGSLTLISGAPGIGKSTLLLQTAHYISEKMGKVLYVSGEESGEQIKIRGDRLGAVSPDLFIYSETNLEKIESIIREIEPVFVIIDSIQTLYKEASGSAPGSVSQVRDCANDIMRIGKGSNIPFFIVAHVTKQGSLAGPRVLEHMVDTVLSFEGERTQEFRILRTNKNRFGTTSEIGVFEMRREGLVEVSNPSQIFIEEGEEKREGSAIVGIIEGTRPILVEIQALVTKTNLNMPRRTGIGIDNSRLNLILAVLEKKLRIPFYGYDVYVNVVGGLSIDGTHADLGVAAALISSIKSTPLKNSRPIVIGEVGLTGEVRPVAYCEKIVNEGLKMGFQSFIVPSRNREKIKNSNANIISVETLIEVVNKCF
ncbi:DNA repair protein RadA [Clostridium sp. DL1XJH146]